MRPFTEHSGIPSRAPTFLFHACSELGPALCLQRWWSDIWLQPDFLKPSFQTHIIIIIIISTMQQTKPEYIVVPTAALQSCVQHTIQPRLLLCEDLQYFGPGSLSDQMDVAYKEFLSFCSARKIYHSQPPFVPKMVAWLSYNFIRANWKVAFFTQVMMVVSTPGNITTVGYLVWETLEQPKCVCYTLPKSHCK